MFFYLYAKEHGWRNAVYYWLTELKKSSFFRRLFCLVFFVMLMLMRTLLNRNMWANPLSDIMGGWTLYDENGELTTEAIENVMLMLPYTALLMWVLKCKTLKKITIRSAMWHGMKFALFTSITIEFLQLLLRLGTLQLSDIFYNTVGGILGGLTYYICYKVKYRYTEHVKKNSYKGDSYDEENN